jgi:SAM-dependent methyltransferase
LFQIILEHYEPSQVTGLDSSKSELAYALTRVTGERVNFLQADAQALPFSKNSFDTAVSGLALNHLLEKARALTEMRRVVRPGGRVAGYVWDYAGEMQLMRRFWDAAIALDPAARERDQARRFPDCKPEPLADLFRGAGLDEVQTRAFDVATIFRDFDDYWVPMTIGEGAITEYILSLTEKRRTSLSERLQQSLPMRADGTIHLMARAWAVSGVAPR